MNLFFDVCSKERGDLLHFAVFSLFGFFGDGVHAADILIHTTINAIFVDFIFMLLSFH